jgi:hypothetical protein
MLGCRSYILGEFFASLSTIIDLAKHRETPTPFGTQHIALIFGTSVYVLSLPHDPYVDEKAAWGPFVVFCESSLLAICLMGG